jgi:Protein of unknown function (DUF2637)
MGSTQMALPMERRNGASSHRQGPAESPPTELVSVLQVVDVDAWPWVRWVTTLAVVLVAAVAAVASYEHMRALAELAGEGWRSWLLPVSVDGLAVAASMTMLVRRRAGLRAGALVWTALLLGLGASLAANVAAADPTVAGRLVAAWPPVALLMAYELLLQQLGQDGGAR